MAMEITDSKNLHRHALPVVIALVGLLLVSGLVWYGHANFSSSDLVSHSLMTHVSSHDTAPHPAIDQAGQTAAQELGH